MKPVGLCFKKEQGKVGELMVVHRCMVCGSVSKNRIAGDDQPGALEHLFTDCCALSAEEKSELMAKGIELLSEKDEYEVTSQLYGRPEAVKRQQNAWYTLSGIDEPSVRIELTFAVYDTAVLPLN